MTRILVVLVLGVLSVGAQAAPIRFVASGTMATSGGAPDFIGIPNGTAWSVDLYIDPNAIDADPDPDEGQYSPILGDLVIGSSIIAMSDLSENRHVVVHDENDIHNPGRDRVIARAFGNLNDPDNPLLGDDWDLANFFLALEAPDMNLFTGDELSNAIGLTMTELTSCMVDGVCVSAAGSRFGLQLIKSGVGFLELRGGIDTLSISIIPVPAAVWLFGSALGLLGWLKRRSVN